MSSPLANRWGLGDRPDLGAMNEIVRLFRSLDVSRPDALPDLSAPHSLVLASDYSGQHAGARGEVYAFLLLDPTDMTHWLMARDHLRKVHGLGQRRMSFKALGDRARQRVLSRFLTAADRLNGILFVVRISKRVGILFDEQSEVDPQLTSALENWTPRTVERLLRVSHLAALLIAGLSRPGQDILWISDQDDVAANIDRHWTMTTVFGTIASNYLEHSLGHIRIATTASDSGQRDLEDLVGIADLAAGAISEVLDNYDGEDWPMLGLTLPAPKTALKTQNLMGWLSDTRQKLKRIIIEIEPGISPSKIRIRHWEFIGSSSL